MLESTIGDFSIIQKKRDVATKLHASFARGGVVLQLLSTVFKIHVKKSPFTMMRAKKLAIPYLLELEPLLELGPMTPNARATAHQRKPVGRCDVALPVFLKKL